jgi:hypothetical protein
VISCESFRKRFHENTEDAALLEHIRSCDRCLDFAATIDADILFRSLGGSDMIPPGGVDAFVSDVMSQVRVREAETAIETRPASNWSRRLAIAAALAITVTGATMVYRPDTAPVTSVPQIAAVKAAPKVLTTKPVIETYDSVNATIVEVPSEGAGADDVKIVMIFDESLPADL